jgi:hypothetical protein
VSSVSELKPADPARTSAPELKPAVRRGVEATGERPNPAGERTTRRRIRPHTCHRRHLQRGRKMREREREGEERNYRI